MNMNIFKRYRMPERPVQDLGDLHACIDANNGHFVNGQLTAVSMETILDGAGEVVEENEGAYTLKGHFQVEPPLAEPGTGQIHFVAHDTSHLRANAQPEAFLVASEGQLLIDAARLVVKTRHPAPVS